MKKTVSFLMLGIVAMSLFGCAGKEDPTANATPPPGVNAHPDAKVDKSKMPGAATMGGGPGAATPSQGLAHP